jgi:DNA-binding MarR family transcriptional regulator
VDTNSQVDAVDQIVNDLRHWRPDLEVIGLPITGRVLRLAQYLTSGREQRLAEFGLTVADFDVLATLRRRAAAESVNVGDLQHAMMLSSSGVTKRLDRLETARLIERHPDPNDRRGVLIRLSQTGIDLIDRAVVAVTVFESGVVSGAIGSDEERLQLETGLRRMLLEHERR